jgi:hypothetical protein
MPGMPLNQIASYDLFIGMLCIFFAKSDTFLMVIKNLKERMNIRKPYQSVIYYCSFQNT